MNRIIKFRGIAKYGNLAGKWVYGSLVYDYDKETFISVSGYSHTGSAFSGSYKVLSETVGQFTGLYDKNGREIYEGDILKITGSNEAKRVAYSNKEAAFGIQYPDGDFFSFTLDISCISEECYEVIGNEYDNPDLLGKEVNHE